ERSPLFQREPERLARCVEAGMLCSVTAGSLRGDFCERARRFSLEILSEGLVHDLASDAHDHHSRTPSLAGATEPAEAELPGVSAQAEWLTSAAPAAILAGKPPPPPPPLSGRGR